MVKVKICSVVLMVTCSGRQFHRSTIRLKKRKLKNIDFKRAFHQCSFTISDVFLGVLKFTYSKLT